MRTACFRGVCFGRGKRGRELTFSIAFSLPFHFMLPSHFPPPSYFVFYSIFRTKFLTSVRCFSNFSTRDCSSSLSLLKRFVSFGLSRDTWHNKSTRKKKTSSNPVARGASSSRRDLACTQALLLNGTQSKITGLVTSFERSPNP